MSDPLLDELRERPVGPAVAKRPAIDEFSREISVSGGTATAEIRDLEGAVNEGTALKYLEQEGLTPSEWEVTGFRKIKYGMGMESVRFTYRKVSSIDPVAEMLDPSVVEGWRTNLLSQDSAIQLPRDGGSTYTLLIADPQLGKKGTEEAVENYKRGVREHVRAARSLGAQVGNVHVAWMGDETENVVNSYENQPHTIELNRTQQLELDYDLRVWALRKVLGLGLPTSASSVISNHGEWTRNGGKEPVTSRGDNASTYVAGQVRSLFDELEPFTGQRVDWTIGGGEPGVTLNLSGVECYFSHGYIEKGRGSSTEIRTKAAIERQILGKTDTLGRVRLWFMAHYHHLYSQEFEGRTLWGCPALEAERSSEYMLDQFGVWSPPGLLGMLVGDGLGSRGWGNANVF